MTGAVVPCMRMTQEALVMFDSKLPACVVATRSTLRFVTLKTEAQLALQVLYRARERLVAGRTRLTNQLRAMLLELGLILPEHRASLGKRLEHPGCCRISGTSGRAWVDGSQPTTMSSPGSPARTSESGD